ncbi:MAG: hypothetical protein HY678_07930 [Chloroflexi bacterium]|nr:hypothetical protein [Chloroflexota bacterium]
MYKQERLEQPATDGLMLFNGTPLKRAAHAVVEGVRTALAAITEPFGGLRQIEVLDPRVRARMSAGDKGIVDATFHGA